MLNSFQHLLLNVEILKPACRKAGRFRMTNITKL
jgi:hypothetical protein